MADDTVNYDHFYDFDPFDGTHACDDPKCLANGVPNVDLGQLAYSLNALADAMPPDCGVTTATFRAADGLYVLLTAPYGSSRAVIGALYTPTLFRQLRESGYTMSALEFDGGVN